jgi:hypothetical protein
MLSLLCLKERVLGFLIFWLRHMRFIAPEFLRGLPSPLLRQSLPCISEDTRVRNNLLILAKRVRVNVAYCAEHVIFL